jgi:hypothetical protein
VGEPANFVPVERRFLGFDRRTILPSVGLLVLVMIWSGVLPAINAAISYTDEVEDSMSNAATKSCTSSAPVRVSVIAAS